MSVVFADTVTNSTRLAARLRACTSGFDIEHDAPVEVKRVPELRLSWGHLALKAGDLNQVGVILPWIIRSNQEQFQTFQRYFRALALMAKNDIFFQFEPNVVTEFIGAFKDAMRSNSDWDGKPETLDAAIDAFFNSRIRADFVQTVKENVAFADQIEVNKRSDRPVTLEDVGKAKIIFDVYMNLKASVYAQEHIQKMKAEGAQAATGVHGRSESGPSRNCLDRLSNRLTKILSVARKLNPPV